MQHYNSTNLVVQKRTKLFQMRTISIYTNNLSVTNKNKKPLIFTDKWPNTLNI